MKSLLLTLLYSIAVVGIAGLALGFSVCRLTADCPILGLCGGPSLGHGPQGEEATGADPANAETPGTSIPPVASTQPSGEKAMSVTESKPVAERKVEHASDESFTRQVLESEVPTLVDFYAEWCGPCRALSPTLEELARETGDAQIIKVNVDENPQLAARYGVTSIPSLAVFKDGQVTARHMGLASKAELKALLSR
jgi:thioredoxin 1